MLTALALTLATAFTAQDGLVTVKFPEKPITIRFKMTVENTLPNDLAQKKFEHFLGKDDPATYNAELLRKQVLTRKYTKECSFAASNDRIFFDESPALESDLSEYLWRSSYYFDGKKSYRLLKNTLWLAEALDLGKISNDMIVPTLVLAPAIFEKGASKGYDETELNGRYLYPQPHKDKLGRYLPAYAEFLDASPGGTASRVLTFSSKRPGHEIRFDGKVNSLPKTITVTTFYNDETGWTDIVERRVTIEILSTEESFPATPVRSLVSYLKQGDSIGIEGPDGQPQHTDYYPGNPMLKELFAAIEPLPFDSRNAAQVLSEAKKRAAEEGKNIFVMFSATWCAPCKALKAKMETEPWHSVLERNYVFVTLRAHEQDGKDGNAGADKLLQEWSHGKYGGIPYYVVLNPKGEFLMDSSAVVYGIKDNHPGLSGEAGRHFLRVLEKTAPKIHEMELRMLGTIVNAPAVPRGE